MLMGFLGDFSGREHLFRSYCAVVNAMVDSISLTLNFYECDPSCLERLW